jgi:putative transposase
MNNHVHFIGIPEREDSMGNVFKYVNMKYSQYFNKRVGAGGHLFQGRFFSSVMDERYMLACARYIERNPVRARIVKKPWLYRWSSACVHCGLEQNDILGVNRLFDFLDNRKNNWQEYIEEEDEDDAIQELREQTRKGRPLATADFIKKLEHKLGRCLTLKQRGRPRKENK